MSWLFSQVLVEEYLGASCSDGEQSAPLNGNPIQQAYCAPDKMTGFSRLSRFGMMFKPLTEDRGKELLMSYLAGFHAKTLVPQEKAQELMENDQECGEKWRASFTKFDPDSCSWKTHQCSLLGDLELFSETWPQWGLMRDGECWEQRMLEQTIRGTEFGLSEKLPTPCASDYRDKPTSKSWKAKGATNYSLANPEIQAKWPTSLASDWKPRGPNSKQQGLAEKVKWPTPDANCGMRGTQENWTPKRKSGHQAQYSINQAVRDRETWHTPQASDCRDRGNISNPLIQRRAEKGKQLNLSMVAHPNSGKLNPDWVEWLMNWPIKWSDLNGFDKTEYKRWQETSATPIQESVQMRTVWWDRDPSQTSHRSQHEQQQEKQHCDSLHQVSRIASCESTLEGSHEGQDLPILRESVHIQTSQRENLQSGVWEQTCMDETEIVPRVGGTGIATVDRLKAIGNGQVPLCAATAWNILSQ